MKKLLYKMNENHTNQQGLTLEEIAVHKQALKIAIAEQQKNVNEAYRGEIGFRVYRRPFIKWLHNDRKCYMGIQTNITNFSHIPKISVKLRPLFIIENLFCTLYHTKAAQHQQPLSSTTYPIVNPPFRLNYVENLLFIP